MVVVGDVDELGGEHKLVFADGEEGELVVDDVLKAGEGGEEGEERGEEFALLIGALLCGEAEDVKGGLKESEFRHYLIINFNIF